MKKILSILFFLPNIIAAQVDTVSLQKVRFEFTIEGGAFYGETNTMDLMPWRADLFANSIAKYGLQDQFGLQVCFFNKFSAEVFYSRDQFQGTKVKIVDELRLNYTDYFIQEHAKNGSYTFYGDNNSNIRYLRMGLSGNIRLTKSKYLQPYAFYAIGNTSFPKGEFAFKELNSNNFYINQYSFEKMRTTGYIVGVRYKYFVDGNMGSTSRLYGHIGLKLEVAYMNVVGQGKVQRKNGITGQETIDMIDVNRNFQYVTLGVFFGLGMKEKRFNNNFLFSTYPIKKRKTLKERMQEKKKSS